jgi:tetratricopeptide (TPR) repeat protein
MLDLEMIRFTEVAAPPVLVIAGDSAAGGLDLTRLSVTARIRGLAAETTVLMTFLNPHDRVLEGELVFPLPEGAVVCGYGLDVEGAIVDGVVVEREKARVIFETEVRKDLKKDPGLVEHVKGNVFRTRVYPLPARGSRQVKVTFVSDLLDRDGAAYFHLPLNVPAPLEEFELSVSVPADLPGPVGLGGGFAFPDFRREGGSLVARTKLAKAKPAKVVVGLPDLPDRYAAVEQGEDGATYFCLFCRPPDPPAAEAMSPGRIGLLWDASLSRAKVDQTRDFRLIEAILRRFGNVTVDLLVFRERAEAVRSFRVTDGDGGELLAVLRDLACDGGTDLRAIAGAPDGCDLHLLFSDGLASVGADLPEPVSAPLFALSGAAESDAAVLRTLAERSGGAYLSLATHSDDDVIDALTRPVLRFLGATGDLGAVDELRPAAGAPVTGRFRLAGRLTGASATLSLAFGRGPRAERESRFEVRARDASPGTVVPRLFAAEKVAELSVRAERNKAELLSIGRRFGLVTPNASLLVLETLEQHLEHRVEPHASREAMRREYLARVTEDARDEERRAREKLSHLGARWEAWIGWWEADHAAKQDFREEKAAHHRFMARMAPPPPAPMAAGAEAPADLMMAMAPMAARAMEESVACGAGAPPSAEPAPVPPRSAEGAVALKPWDPDTPYLDEMKRAGAARAYARYLELRAEHGGSPAFYLDCAHFFLREGRREEGLRVLSCIPELRLGDPQLLRIAAGMLDEAEDSAAAAELFEEVLRLRPEEPQSHRDLALVLARRGEVARAVDLLARVVTGDWDDRFAEIELTVLMDLNGILARAEREGKPLPPPDLPPKLLRLLDCDVRAVLAWDTDLTDVDLHVVEPNGEECYYGHQRTSGGGHLSRDFRLGYGPEEYFLRRAPAGKYAVRAKYFSSARQDLSGATTLRLCFFTNYGRANEKMLLTTLRLTEPKDIVDVATIDFR